MQIYYETIIFDFDGTIADSLQASLSIYKQLATKYHLKQIPRHEVTILRTKKPLEILSYLEIPVYKLPFLLIQGRKLFTNTAEKLKPFPDIKKVLQTLSSKYKMGILTSNTEENVKAFLKKHDLQLFSFIHSEKNLFGKDKALLHLIEKYKLHKDKTIYVGDEVRDIESCIKIKLPIISVTWGFNEKGLLMKSNPTYIVDYPKDILTIL